MLKFGFAPPSESDTVEFRYSRRFFGCYVASVMHRSDPEGQRSPRSAPPVNETVPHRRNGPQAVLASQFYERSAQPSLSSATREFTAFGPAVAQPNRTTRARARGEPRHEGSLPSSPHPVSPSIRRARDGATTLVPEGMSCVQSVPISYITSLIAALGLGTRHRQYTPSYHIGVEYLRAVSVANTTGAPLHNVPGSLHTVRVVSPVPGDDNFNTLDRAHSASSFESMHSIDHGSLGLDSRHHEYQASLGGGGPWVASARAIETPGHYEAYNNPISTSIRRSTAAPSQEYSGPDIAADYGVSY